MLPAVVVFGAVAAFATNAAKQNQKQNFAVTGYYYDNTETMDQDVNPSRLNVRISEVKFVLYYYVVRCGSTARKH